MAWLRGVGESTEAERIVDTREAIQGLLGCDMTFRYWLAAREAKWMRLCLTLGNRRDLRTPDMKRLSVQSNRRRQAFDKRLTRWANKFGCLGLDGDWPDYVDGTMRAAYCVRSWVLPESPHIPPRSGTFLLDDFDPIAEINEGAGRCSRDPKTGAWIAPTLWSAICHSVQHSRDYGWEFAECAADDCLNVFLKKPSHKIMCSPRCGKRMRDHLAKQRTE